ncbi:MAG: hypothetical protein IJY42_05340 [Clostridia bacterium]|nr:hypothetical protein [Clostridia bacterium]
MLIFKQWGCRIFQTAFLGALPFLPYREPRVLSFCSELGDFFRKEQSASVLVVTDAGIVKNRLMVSLEEALTKT